MPPKPADVLLSPKSVALIGASSDPGKLTARPLSFMKTHGFKGKVYPIHPTADEIMGFAAYKHIDALPDVPEHAYILLDSDHALDALEACGKSGVPCATVLADGFGEAGQDGQSRQRRLVGIAKQYGLNVVGPNSIGVVNTSNGFTCTANAAFAASDLPKGRFAVLSQSGSVIGTLLSRGAAVGLGFHSYVSLGNEACLGIGEVGQLLLDDPTIDGFVLFMETLRRPDAFAAFATEARRRDKPILTYMVGRSDAGQTLAASHTGAMTGGARALEAFLDAQGVIRVQTLEVLAELANALTTRPRLVHRPKTVTVVTTTGGGGGMVYDQIGLRNVDLAPIGEDANRTLRSAGVSIKPGPLVDVTLAGTKYNTMKQVISALMQDPATGLIVAAIGSSAQFNPELAVKPIVDAVAEHGNDGAPVVAVPIPHAPESLQLFNQSGVPAFRTPENAAEAVAVLMSHTSPKDTCTTLLPDGVLTQIAATAAGTLNEAESAAVLAKLGLNTVSTAILTDDAPLPNELPFDGPYALKVLSKDIPHKSDAGGVRLGLYDRSALIAALNEIKANLKQQVPDAYIEGFLIQKMIAPVQEAIIGFTRDPVVGPLVTVGVGGVLTEIYHDIALRPAPVSSRAAEQMIEEVRGFALARGYRKHPKGDLKALADAVSVFSRLAFADSIEEAEANPVAILPEDQGVVLLDALIKVRH